MHTHTTAQMIEETIYVCVCLVVFAQEVVESMEMPKPKLPPLPQFASAATLQPEVFQQKIVVI